MTERKVWMLPRKFAIYDMYKNKLSSFFYTHQRSLYRSVGYRNRKTNLYSSCEQEIREKLLLPTLEFLPFFFVRFTRFKLICYLFQNIPALLFSFSDCEIRATLYLFDSIKITVTKCYIYFSINIEGKRGIIDGICRFLNEFHLLSAVSQLETIFYSPLKYFLPHLFFSWCLLLFIICFIASLYGVPPLINMYLKTFPSFVSLNLPIDGFEIPRVEGLLFRVPLHPFVPSLNWMRVVFSLSQTPWVIDWSKLIYYCSKIDLVIPDFYVPFSGKLTKVNGVK